MAYADLREFIAALERAGELRRIAAPADPILEITEITDRVSKRGGPALLFENPRGYAGKPLLINQFGSRRRMQLALGVQHADEVAGRIRKFLDLKPAPGLLDKLKMLPMLAELGAFFPRTVKHGAEHMREHVRAAAGAAAEEILGRAHGLPETQAPPAAAEGRIEVAVAIGTDPATTFSAILPAPPGVDELMLAGFLRQKPVELVKCETVDLEVPADAEIVLEGYVDLSERRVEGPFGDHTGFYSLADSYPVLHLTCLSHRPDAIYATTIVGKPPMEDAWMGEAVGRIFLPLMQLQFPEIVDINMPFEGVFHNLMLVSIRKSYPGHARKIMNGIWGLGQAMFTKCIVVVDHDTDVQNVAEVVLKVLNHIDPERDIQFTLGPVDALDHASRLPNFGSKMGVDATRKWPNEGFLRPWPKEILMDAETKKRVDELWPKLGLD